jgi:hypothetical protein
VWLTLYIDAGDVEPGPVKSDRGAASAAKQIESARTSFLGISKLPCGPPHRRS